MRYKLTIIKGFKLPKSEALLSTFVRGVKAFQEKKSKDQNPYDLVKSLAFFREWYRGWMAGHEGYAGYSEPESRRRDSREIIWLRKE